MAGDWIKFDVTTPDKPEVVQMAAALGIDQDAVVGKLLRVWTWADQNTITCDGDRNAVTVTEQFLDRLTFCQGFAKAMVKVGWLLGSDGGYLFPNFDRHNGKTAKDRAQTNRRVAKSRASGNGASVTSVTQQALEKPLPEKRREEKEQDQKQDQKPERASPSGSRLPIDWVLPDDYRAWCEAKHPEIDPDGEAEKFADHWHAKAGKDARKTDWLATWRNWLRTDFPKAMKARAGPSVQAGPASKTRSAIEKLQALKLPETPHDPDMAAQRTAGRPEQAALPAPR